MVPSIPAPWIVIFFEIVKVEVQTFEDEQFPAGTIIVSPSEALLYALVTAVLVQFAAFIVLASASVQSKQQTTSAIPKIPARVVMIKTSASWCRETIPALFLCTFRAEVCSRSPCFNSLYLQRFCRSYLLVKLGR